MTPGRGQLASRAGTSAVKAVWTWWQFAPMNGLAMQWLPVSALRELSDTKPSSDGNVDKLASQPMPPGMTRLHPCAEPSTVDYPNDSPPSSPLPTGMTEQFAIGSAVRLGNDYRR